MSEKLHAWQELSEALDELVANDKEISGYLDTRHPEEGGILVYTPLKHMLEKREETISKVRDLQSSLVPVQAPADPEEKAVRLQVDAKISELLNLDAKNNERLNELGDFYKEKLKANKQARETLNAYTQQNQTAAELSMGSLFNKTN